MPVISTGLGLAIGGIASAGAAVASGVVGSKAATKASKTQADTALQVAQINDAAAKRAEAIQTSQMAEQKRQYDQVQGQLQPFIAAGQGGVNKLSSLLGTNGAVPLSSTARSPRMVDRNGQLVAMNPTSNPSVPLSSTAGGMPNVNSKLVSPSSPGGFTNPAIDVGGGTTGFQPTDAQGNPINGPGNPISGAPVVDAQGNPVPQGGGQSTVPLSSTGAYFPTGSSDDPGSLDQGWDTSFQYDPFSAPTDVTEQNDPGFKFRMKMGQQALENSAAARGSVLNSETMKAIQAFGQDYSSNEYQNVYNRDLTNWTTNYNKALGEYQNAYNIFNNNQSNQFNRLAALAGIGQTGTSQLSSSQLGNASIAQNGTTALSNTILGNAANVGQQMNNAAAARGSGYVGSANATSGGITGATGALNDLVLLRSILGQGKAKDNINV